MSSPTIPLASLRFDGERFADHSLDVDCVGELASDKRLVLECDKELWRRAHPDYERLPKASKIASSCASRKSRRARRCTAADRDDLLPAELPRNVIPLFREFGRTRRESETLFVQSRHRAAAAPCTARARQRLAEWMAATYEDVVDATGEVNMANVRWE
jgi:hypothetical protein